MFTKTTGIILFWAIILFGFIAYMVHVENARFTQDCLKKIDQLECKVKDLEKLKLIKE